MATVGVTRKSFTMVQLIIINGQDWIKAPISIVTQVVQRMHKDCPSRSPQSGVSIAKLIQIPILPWLPRSDVSQGPSEMSSLLVGLRSLVGLRHFSVLNVPLHENTAAVVNSRDVMDDVLNSLHCPVEILWLELSRSTSKIDLSLRSSWSDPHVWVGCVLNRLVMNDFALAQLSQIVLSQSKVSCTHHDREAVIILSS